MLRKPFQIFIFLSFLVVITTGCSVVGKSNVEIAPYEVLEKDGAYELRHYERLVLVSTGLSGRNDRGSSFNKLFQYISGKNDQAQEIPMTAPVFMDMHKQIEEKMSFVLPYAMDLETAPIPQDPTVKLEEIKNYRVATITFNGLLEQDNIDQHKKLLEQWVEDKSYEVIGPARTAGYNPPFTLPAVRRNEILIPVKE